MIDLGRKVPEPFLDKPEILPVSQFYWTAFCDLVTERQIGMGVGPIPRSKAREYAFQQGVVDEDGFDRFWAIIHEVDTESISLMNAAWKTTMPPAKRPRRSPRQPP